MNISEFLEARIAEDEAAAREVETDFQFDPSSPLYSPLDVYSPDGYDTAPVISIDSTRVLAECAAKRALLDIDFQTSAVLDNHRVLAAIYKDHPDYQQEWSIRG